jgi:DNA helicase-2/ATP-dependent DNA helicase PcrA
MDTLANTTNNKMKNIVQTIQKEQNSIIRTNENTSIIVQGVAGSGKTAIAMHRVAYLLYRLRNKIKSSNIKLISPNNAFSSYISSILPELHEEDIEKIQLDKICQRELRKTCIVEPRFEQVERITNNPKEFNEYTQKISEEFCNKLTEFITTNVLESFN